MIQEDDKIKRANDFWILCVAIFGIIILLVEYYAMWLPIPSIATKPTFLTFFILFGFWIWLVGMVMFVFVAESAIESVFWYV
jgi:hypothetical protein